jgi:hypothetical protein
MSSSLHLHVVGFKPDYAIIGSYDAPPPFLCGPQYFGASEEVECQLPQFTVDGISDHFRKSGSVGMMVKMTDTEVLFNYIADL